MIQMRKTTFDDIPAVMEIIEQAKDALKSQGVDQWQDGYPNADTIAADIENSVAYVFTDCEGIVGTAMITFEGEDDYAEIEGGDWRRHTPFCTIHRIAVREKAKGTGIAMDIMAHIEILAKNEDVLYLRMDTHADNKRMQGFLKKAGFVKCGTIYLGGVRSEHTRRIGFDKVLS